MIQPLKNLLIEGSNKKPVVLDIFCKKECIPHQVIIFSHGFKGFKDWGPFNLMAQRFAESGFIFIKFNFSHNGTTPDHPEEFTDLDAFGNNNLIIELDDLSGVIDFISSQSFREHIHSITSISMEHSSLSIHLMGHSRGGGISILKGSEDHRIKKIVTLASVNSFGSFFSEEEVSEWKRNGVRYEMNSRTGQMMPKYYQYWEAIEPNRDQLDIPYAIKTLSKSLLMIHGMKDETIPNEKATEMNSWNPQQTQLLLLENANHTFGGKHPWNEPGLPKELLDAIEAIIQFLNA